MFRQAQHERLNISFVLNLWWGRKVSVARFASLVQLLFVMVLSEPMTKFLLNPLEATCASTPARGTPAGARRLLPPPFRSPRSGDSAASPAPCLWCGVRVADLQVYVFCDREIWSAIRGNTYCASGFAMRDSGAQRCGLLWRPV